MSDTTLPDNVLTKIRKLLALAADKRGNEHECAVAAEMAQSILAQYGLEMAQLGDVVNDDPASKRAKVSHDRSAMYNYQRVLMEHVAKTHFCRYFTVEEFAESFGKTRKVRRHQLLGRSINVQAATMVYDYLIDTMDRLLPWQGMEKRGKNALAWLDGCSSRLGERLDQKRRDMEAESERKKQEEATRSRHPSAAPAGNALVLADAYGSEDDLNTDFMYGYEPGTTARNRAAHEAEYAAKQAKRNTLVAEGMDADKAWYIAHGYSESWYAAKLEKDAARAAEQAVVLAKAEAKANKSETDAQRAKREQREKRDEQAYYDRLNRTNSKIYHPAYMAGRQTGENIGLDTQVKSDSRKVIS